MSFYKIINKYTDITLIKDELSKLPDISMEYFIDTEICDIETLLNICIDNAKNYLRISNNKKVDSMMENDLGISKSNDIVLSDIDISFIQTIKEYVVFSLYHTVCCLLSGNKLKINKSIYILILNYINDTNTNSITKLSDSCNSKIGDNYGKMWGDIKCLREFLNLEEKRFSGKCLRKRMSSLVVDIIYNWKDCPFRNVESYKFKTYHRFKLNLQKKYHSELKNNDNTQMARPIESNISVDYAKERLFGFEIVDEILKIIAYLVESEENEDILYIPYNNEYGKEVYINNKEDCETIKKNINEHGANMESEEKLNKTCCLPFEIVSKYVTAINSAKSDNTLQDVPLKYVINALCNFFVEINDNSKENADVKIISELTSNVGTKFIEYIFNLYLGKNHKLISTSEKRSIMSEFILNVNKLFCDYFILISKNKTDDKYEQLKSSITNEISKCSANIGKLDYIDTQSYFQDKIVTDVIRKVSLTKIKDKDCYKKVEYFSVDGNNHSLSLRVHKKKLEKFILVLLNFLKLPDVFSRKKYMYYAINLYCHYDCIEHIDNWEKEVNQFIDQYSEITFPILEGYFAALVFENIADKENDTKIKLEKIRDELSGFIDKNYKNRFIINCNQAPQEKTNIAELEDLELDLFKNHYPKVILEALKENLNIKWI